MAVIGAVFGLLVVGSDLSLMSMIGIIMLMGLVSKNAILLVDFTKQQRAAGVERNAALQKAALTRLRPIARPSLSMIFGMLPLALALGPGAESRAPMNRRVDYLHHADTGSGPGDLYYFGRYKKSDILKGKACRGQLEG